MAPTKSASRMYATLLLAHARVVSTICGSTIHRLSTHLMTILAPRYLTYFHVKPHVGLIHSILQQSQATLTLFIPT